MEELFRNASLCDCHSANIRVGGSEREPAPRRAKNRGLSARHGGVCSTHRDGASRANCGVVKHEAIFSLCLCRGC